MALQAKTQATSYGHCNSHDDCFGLDPFELLLGGLKVILKS